MNKLNRTLTFLLAFAILGSIAAFIYAINVPAQDRTFTEFYLLDPTSRTAVYPENVRVEEEVTLLVCVVNREKKDKSYRVEVRIADAPVQMIEAGTIANGETWEQSVVFAFSEVGDRQRVDFLLFRAGEDEPYRSLYLLVSVNE